MYYLIEVNWKHVFLLQSEITSSLQTKLKERLPELYYTRKRKTTGRPQRQRAKLKDLHAFAYP